MEGDQGNEGVCNGTYASGKGELKVVGTKSVILNGSFDDFIKELGFPEDIFSHAKPKTEKLFGVAVENMRHFFFPFIS